MCLIKRAIKWENRFYKFDFYALKSKPEFKQLPPDIQLDWEVSVMLEEYDPAIMKLVVNRMYEIRQMNVRRKCHLMAMEEAIELQRKLEIIERFNRVFDEDQEKAFELVEDAWRDEFHGWFDEEFEKEAEAFFEKKHWREILQEFNKNVY